MFLNEKCRYIKVSFGLFACHFTFCCESHDNTQEAIRTYPFPVTSWEEETEPAPDTFQLSVCLDLIPGLLVKKNERGCTQASLLPH
ncbi:hypothetical protein Y1Q_0008762 [Alligator mississippiensis]|uniref:Uncharacterized protein n=1 Tax=Alligator mississippiensis TaxID=8496 RepID=A0A151NA24_ALLMI|nr:hypothetical protein Y1Q_0008762 [Alligator mississippiensis]